MSPFRRILRDGICHLLCCVTDDDYGFFDLQLLQCADHMNDHFAAANDVQWLWSS